MLEKMILAGFGGQGIMLLGKLLCTTFMEEGMHVTWIPSYGAEQRGGTANCHVIVSSKPVGSPMVEHATTVLVMNQPSFEKFKARLVPGGTLFVNTSLIKIEGVPENVKVVEIPATDTASKLGDVRLANMIVLGAMMKHKNWLSAEKFSTGLKAYLPGKKAAMLDLNRKAIQAGIEIAAGQ
ncbi:MAG: 2-oxoacid:acceptor oxidoreductase family protein [Planctomycetota bacterium]|nr:2-oxoacid:acceptor oxidoreductase family protein [Planctomycetota bacterium]